MLKQVRSATILFLQLSLVTGGAYPLLVTVVAKAVFPHQANGSLIERNGMVFGSALIGQFFDDTRYFWGRPSATLAAPYDSSASSGSNLGPTNPDHMSSAAGRVAHLMAAHPEQAGAVPVDLVTASASGLDPHISPAAAEYQLSRVARARGLTEATVRTLIAENTEGRLLGILGEPRVNVLGLNLALDEQGKVP